jgi:hypothetical protein
MTNKDWTGYLVNAGKHRLRITGKWKEEKPDMWWWKCADCYKASGVLSTAELVRLNESGIVDEPDGTEITATSAHPTEESGTGHYYGGYGWD